MSGRPGFRRHPKAGENERVLAERCQWVTTGVHGPHCPSCHPHFHEHGGSRHAHVHSHVNVDGVKIAAIAKHHPHSNLAYLPAHR